MKNKFTHVFITERVDEELYRTKLKGYEECVGYGSTVIEAVAECINSYTDLMYEDAEGELQ